MFKGHTAETEKRRSCFCPDGKDTVNRRGMEQEMKQSTMKKKALWISIASLFLTAILTVLLLQMMPENVEIVNGSEEGAHLLYSSSKEGDALEGYEKRDQALFVTHSDPQIHFDTSSLGDLSSVSLVFSEKLQNSLDIQVFYDNGTGYSEKNSRRSTCQPGTVRKDIDLPDSPYRSIRVDIDGAEEIQLESIIAWHPGAAKANSGRVNLPWVAWGLVLLVVLSAGIMMMNGSGTVTRRAGWIISAFIVSLLFVSALKIRLKTDIPFNFNDPDKLIVSLSDVGLTMLLMSWIASFFRPFRRLFGMKEKWFTGSEKLFLLICFTVYAFWMITFSGWAYGPDEAMRYDIPKFIFENGRLPLGWEESIRNSIWGTSYGFDISLPYLTSSYFMELASLTGSDHYSLLTAARMSSLLSVTGVAAMALWIGKELLGDKPVRWLYAVLMSLLPQVVFLSSYVNLDTFSLLSAMMIVKCWIDCLKEKWSPRTCSWLAAAIAMCFLSYKFAFGYILMSVLLYAAWYIRHRKDFSFGLFIRRGLLIVAIAIAICGWKFIRNAVIYNGDFLSLNASKPYAELYAMEEYKPSSMVSLSQSGVSLVGMLRNTTWLKVTLESLIGTFGYLNIRLPERIYQIYNIIFLVGILSSSLVLFCRKEKPTWNQVFLILAMAGAALSSFAISVYFSWSWDYQAQGRYIITTLPFVMLMICGGYDKLAEVVVPGGIREKFNAGNVIGYGISGFVFVSMFIGYMQCLRHFGMLGL